MSDYAYLIPTLFFLFSTVVCATTLAKLNTAHDKLKRDLAEERKLRQAHESMIRQLEDDLKRQRRSAARDRVLGIIEANRSF